METYEPKVGDAVKRKDQKNDYVWTIESIQDGDAVLVRQEGRYTATKVRRGSRLDNLIHVCNRSQYQNYYSQTCGRPVKEGNLCGIHAGAEKRVKANRERERKDAEAAAQQRELRLEIRDRVVVQLTRRGFIVQTYDISFDTNNKPYVKLSVEELLSRADELATGQL